MAEYAEYGYWGLFFASFLAATVLPLSSDVVLTAMILGGFDTLTCIIIATFGNWLGGMSSYFLGYLGKWEWIEKRVSKKQEKLHKVKHWIDRYGCYTAFFTWLPVIGDPLAIALGFARSNMLKVSVYMLMGKLTRFVVVAYLAMKGMEIAGW